MSTHPPAKGEIKVNRGRRAPAQNGELDSALLRASLPGRHPDEVLGNIADSNLVPGIILATLGTLVLLAICTVLPYWMTPSVEEASAKSAPAPTSNANTDNRATEKESPSPTSVANSTAPTSPKKKSKPETNAAKLLDKLDEDDVAPSSPDVNPLENKGDDLLDGLK